MRIRRRFSARYLTLKGYNMRDLKKLFIWMCVCWTFISTVMPLLAPEDELPVEIVVRTEIIHHNKYVTEYVEPTPHFFVTSVEREMLARLLWTEARGESIECQRAVVSVVMNRVRSDSFPNSIEEVIKQKNSGVPQFDLGDKLYDVTPNETQYEAVDYVIWNGCTVPDWVEYFRANHHHEWGGYTQYVRIDHTYFGGFK